MPARRSVHAPLSTIASISDSSRKNINHGETVYDVPPRTPYRDCSRSAPAICRAVCERISPNRQAKKAVPILPLFQCEKVCNHVIIVIMALQAKWLISRPNRLFFRNQPNQASIVGFIPQKRYDMEIDGCPPSFVHKFPMNHGIHGMHRNVYWDDIFWREVSLWKYPSRLLGAPLRGFGLLPRLPRFARLVCSVYSVVLQLPL